MDTRRHFLASKPLRYLGRFAAPGACATAPAAFGELSYQALAATVSDPVISFAQDGSIRHWNRAAEEIFGYSPSEASGGSIFQLVIDETSVERFRESLHGPASTAPPPSTRHPLEIVGRSKSGDVLPLAVTTTVIQPIAEQATYLAVFRDLRERQAAAAELLALKESVIGTHKDITKRKQAEAELRASEARFRSMFEEAPLGVALVDTLTGKIQEVNSQFAAIAGRTKEEMAAIDWMSITHPDDVQGNLDLMARMRAGEIPGVHMDKRYRRPDGSYVWVNMTIAPTVVADPSQPRHLCMAKDITDVRAVIDELRESHARFLAITAACPDALLVTQLSDGVIRYVNEQCGRMFDVPAAELLNQRAPDFYANPADRQTFVGMLKDKGCVHDWEVQFKRADGTPFWTTVSARLGMFAGEASIYASLKDITERKRAEEELRNFRTAVEQSGNPIVITDADGGIEYANPAFEHNSGYPLAEVLGRNLRILKSGAQNPEFYRHLWSTIRSGNIWRGRFHNKRKDGTLYWESTTISPVQNDAGEIAHFIAIKEDITERKAIEGRLSEALVEAQSAAKAKSEFLAVMSHELRTPLNGVLGFAELLAESRLDVEQQSFLRTITSSGSHLLAVVNDILDFSSLENGLPELRADPLALGDLIRWSVDSMRQAAAEKGLEIRWESHPDVPQLCLGDGRRIQQILLNLLGNAVKFTAQGTVVLRVAPAAVGGRWFLDFSVEDSGIGIQSEALARLFKPFSQADSSIRREFGGTGLGLAISQRLAEAMGGSLTVSSVPGLGSTFTFRLPNQAADFVDSDGAPPPLRVEQPSDGTPLAPPGGRVLVVEDDAVSGVLAQRMLASLGYRAVHVCNGLDALAIYPTEPFAAILMDMSMPVMDGLAATRRIRKMEAELGREPVPIIALTGNVMPGDHQRCLDAGMNEFLSKPYRKDLLAESLRRLVRPFAGLTDGPGGSSRDRATFS